jgi:hypothetical protein
LTVQAFAFYRLSRISRFSRLPRLASLLPLRRLDQRAAVIGCAVLLALGAALPRTASAQMHSNRSGPPATQATTDLAACNSADKTSQARATCLDELRHAQAANRLGKLENYGDFRANALKRCEIFKDSADLAACRARMLQQGNTEGSVSEGGILREAEVPATPAEPGAQ